MYRDEIETALNTTLATVASWAAANPAAAFFAACAVLAAASWAYRDSF